MLINETKKLIPINWNFNKPSERCNWFFDQMKSLELYVDSYSHGFKNCSVTSPRTIYFQRGHNMVSCCVRFYWTWCELALRAGILSGKKRSIWSAERLEGHAHRVWPSLTSIEEISQTKCWAYLSCWIFCCLPEFGTDE